MADQIIVPKGLDKKALYQSLLPQLEALVEGESDAIANISNVIAALKYGMDFFWVGIYRVDGESEKADLVLGPFQGPVACTRIAYGKGVCGKARQEGSTIIVEDVDKFPGHIACSSLSRSEIVVPIYKGLKLAGVLDVDSTELSSFDSTDQLYLEKVSKILAQFI